MNRQESQEAGCNDFLPKPVQNSELFDKLQHYLNLIWIYEAENKLLESIVSLEEMIFPPSEQLINLYKAAKTGYIQDIQVRSLRIFSRLDEAKIKEVDLHLGIDSTLMILHSRLRATHERPAIEVIKEYGELVPIECYAGQLNQVFMNILSNAIDAIDEKINNLQVLKLDKSGGDKLMSSSLSTQLSTSNLILSKIEIKFVPQIKICTELTEDKKLILIQIIDNGIGMTQEIQQRIFEQFFTTKDVGKGTGLGLAIAHQIIVEKHRGTLEVKSVTGHGSQFTITIPIY